MTISATMATKAMAPHRNPNATATAPLTESVDNSDKAPVVRNILAERYKTQMCRHYEAKGGMAATFKCPYESKCMFAHGPDDLRTLEMNLRDGILSEESIEAFRRAQRCLRKRANKAARKALAAAAASDSANNDKSNVADATTSLDASVSPGAIAKVFDCESQRYGRPSFLSPVTTAFENVFSPTTGAHNPTATHLLLGDTVHVLNESYNDDAGASYTNTPKMFGVSVSSTRSDSGKISPMVPAPLVTNDVEPFDSNQPYVYANYCHNGGIGGRICVDPTTTMAGLVEEESLGTYGPSSYGSTMATSISSWGFSRTQSVQLRPNHRVLPAPRHHMNAPQQRYRHDPYKPLGCQLSQ